MNKMNKHLKQSHSMLKTGSIFFCSLCLFLAIVLVVSLMPTSAFSYLGQNTVQPAFAQLAEGMEKQRQEASEPWNVIGGIEEAWHFPTEYDSEILSEDYLFEDNGENEEGVEKYRKYSDEEIQAEIDRLNTKAANDGPIAIYKSITYPDGKELNTEKELRDAFANKDTQNGCEIDIKIKGTLLLGGRLRCCNDSKIVLNMHGSCISRKHKAHDEGEVIGIKKDTELTINGVSSEEEKGYEHTGLIGYINYSGKSSTFTVYGAVLGGGDNDNGGGGINIWGSNNVITLNNCKVFGNKSNGTDYMENGVGGNIRVASDNNDLFLNNCEISRGYAENPGGGIGIAEEADSNNFYLKNTHIDINFSADEGAGFADKGTSNAIFGDAVYGDLEHGSSISNNKTDEEGGGYVAILDIPVGSSDTVFGEVHGVNFIGNSGLGGGGGVAVIYGNVSFTDCNFVDNKTDSDGGGLFVGREDEYIWHNQGLSLANCYISKNKSHGWGAGIYTEKQAGATPDVGLSGKIVCNENYRENGDECDIYLDNFPSYTQMESDQAYISSSVTNDSFIGVQRANWNTDASYWVTNDTGVYNPRCYFSNNGAHHIDYNKKTRRLEWFDGGKPKPDGPFDFEVKEIKHQVAIDNPVDSLNYESGGYKYPVYRGTTSYGIMTSSDDYMSTYYYYSDGFFADDPQLYNDHLSSLSMTAEIACSRENQYMSDMTGQDIDYSTKCTNIAQFFADIGCNQQDIFMNEHYLVKPDTNSIGCAIASKQLTLYNEEGEPDDSYILMPIVVRGLGYEAEWTSNFLLGEEGPHQGFSNAANKVINNIEQYIWEHELNAKAEEGKIKFWIMGHSRAGATSNLAGKRLTDNYGKDGNKVFCYTFEPPMCADANNMDLVREPYTYNGEYKNIHNVINYADIVIHIPYVGMKFTRYGVTHYLPGSDTKEDPSKWPIVYDLVDVADNYPVWPNYWDDDSNYVEARNRMLKQYGATNPYEYYADSVHSAIVLILPPGIIDDGSMRQAEVAITQAIYDLFEYSFIQRSELTLRQRYTTKSSRCTNSFEYSVGDILRIFMSLNPTDQSRIMTEFGSITDYIGAGDIFEFLFSQDLTDYINDNDNDKWDFINNINKKIKTLLYNSRTFKEKVSSEDRAKIFEDLKNVLYYVLNFASVDWHRDKFWDIERKADLKGLPVISTLVKSVGFILMNHYPECSLAWVRAYDDYYQSDERDDTSPVKVKWSMCDNPTDPKILYNEKEYEGKVSNENDDIEPIDFDKANIFQLFTDGNDGDVIYYNMEKTDNPSEVKDPTATYEANHYQTNITVDTDPTAKPPVDLANIGDEDYDIYTIKAVSLRFNKFSNVRTFKLKIHNGYNVIIESPAYEKHINKRIQAGSNVLLGTLPTYKGKKFLSWKVENKNGEDVTDYVFVDEDNDEFSDSSNHDPLKACNKNINTTWVKMVNYSLHFIAQYENPESEIHIDIDECQFNENFPQTIQPSYVIDGHQISPFIDLNLKWHKDTKDGEDVTDKIMEPNTTYVWEASINYEPSKGIILPEKDALKVFENDIEIDPSQFEIEYHYDIDKPYLTIFRTVKYDDVVAQSVANNDSIIQIGSIKDVIPHDDVYKYLYNDVIPSSVAINTNHGQIMVSSTDQYKIWSLEGQYTPGEIEALNSLTFISNNLKNCLPDYVDKSKSPDLYMTVHLYVGNNFIANEPVSDINVGSYSLYAEDEFKINLKNGLGFDMRYTVDGTEPSESSLLCHDGDFINIDWKNKESVTVKAFTIGGTYEDKNYEKSKTNSLTYSFITKTPKHTLRIWYVDEKLYPIQDECDVIKYAEDEEFIFSIKNFQGYEFCNWLETTPWPDDPLITSENEKDHRIKASNRMHDYTVYAVYSPSISKVEIRLKQPVALNKLSTNISSAKICAKDIDQEITDPEDLDKFITFHWIYELGETWPDTPVIAKYGEEFLASIEINSEYFKDKKLNLPLVTNIVVFNYDTDEEICSGYYKKTKSDDTWEIGSLFINAKPPATPKAKLLSIDSLPEIRNVQHGISIEQLKSALPTTVGISAEGGIRDKAEIDWDLSKCIPPYDPESIEPQFLTIPGKAIIPEYIDNEGETTAIPTDLTIRVNVDGASRAEDPSIYPDPMKTYYHNIKASLACETDNSEIYYKVKLKTIEPNGVENVTEDEEYSLYNEPFDITCDDGKKIIATVSCYSKAEGYRQSMEVAYSLTIDRTYKKCIEVIMPEPFEIPVYEQSKIVPTLVPEDTEDNRLNFESSDESVASVGLHSGEITAVGVGTCTITATTSRGSVSGSTIVTVTPLELDVSGPQEDYVWHSGLDQEYTIDAEYDTFQGVYVDDSTTPLDPSNYTTEPKPVSHGIFGDRPKVENQTIVKIKASYLDTLERKEHKFKFAFPDGYGIGKQTVRFVDCEKISIWPPLMYLPLNGQGTMKVASYVPENTDDKTVTYESSAPQIASVDPNTGLITAHGTIGQCTITTTTKWGHISCNTSVLVVDKVYQVDGPQDDYVWHSGIDQDFIVHHSIDTFNAIKLDGGQTLTKDEQYTIEADGENTKITLKSSYLDTVERGEHYIEFIYGDGIGLSTNKVRFIDCEQVSFDPAQLDIEVYSDAQLNLVLTPENTDDNIMTYTSNNPEVASVDETGKVTANAMGDCEITATTKWGEVSGSANIHVHGLTYEFVGTPELTYVLTSNESRTFTVAVDPSKFVNVTCDGTEVDKNHYEVNKEEPLFGILQFGEGNTVVKILPSLFETLSADTHEIAINFDDGSAKASMSIVYPKYPAITQTGDGVPAWVYDLSILLAATVCLCGIAIRLRKKR